MLSTTIRQIGFWALFLSLSAAFLVSAQAQSRPVTLPGTQDSHDKATSAVRLRRSPPTIRHSVPESTMAIWKRLALPLPNEIYETKDVADQFDLIAQYLGISIEVDSASKQRGYPKIDKSPYEYWFSTLREYVPWDSELLVSPSGIIIRAKAETDVDDTSDDYDEIEPTKVSYDVTELAIPSDQLVWLIYKFVHHYSWDEQGGRVNTDCATITTKNGRALVVRNHEDAQAAVLMFLESLAYMSVEGEESGARPTSFSTVQHPRIRVSHTPKARNILKWMESPTPPDLRTEHSLEDLILQLRLRGLPVHVDREAGVDLQMMIDLRQTYGTLYHDLYRELHRKGVGLYAGNHWIEIDSAMGPLQETLLYDITSLQISTDTMINLIQTAVSPFEWEENGGRGNIDSVLIEGRHLLVVLQTPDVHWQVRRFLERLADFVAKGESTAGFSHLPSTPIATNQPREGNGLSSTAVAIPANLQGQVSHVGHAFGEGRFLNEVERDALSGHFDLQFEDVSYPLFYDVTPLEFHPGELENLINTTVLPLSWEDNGGPAGNTVQIVTLGTRRILVATNTTPVHHEIVGFFAELTKTMEIAPIRSNWDSAWAQHIARHTIESADTDEPVTVRVYDVSRFRGELADLEQQIIAAIETESWEENGGDYTSAFAEIDHRRIFVVRQQHRTQLLIEKFLRHRLY